MQEHNKKKAACRQLNILQKHSVVSLHYLAQHNRSEAMRATCMCVCVCVHQCVRVRVYVCWGEWSVGVCNIVTSRGDE